MPCLNNTCIAWHIWCPMVPDLYVLSQCLVSILYCISQSSLLSNLQPLYCYPICTTVTLPNVQHPLCYYPNCTLWINAGKKFSKLHPLYHQQSLYHSMICTSWAINWPPSPTIITWSDPSMLLPKLKAVYYLINSEPLVLLHDLKYYCDHISCTNCIVPDLHPVLLPKMHSVGLLSELLPILHPQWHYP